MAKRPCCAECSLFCPKNKDFQLELVSRTGLQQPAHIKHYDRVVLEDLKVYFGFRVCSWPGNCFGNQICQRPAEFEPRK
ncbi:MAG TPA: hypothetical protein PK639_00885 [Candidatus Woesebacteria bacterium]|nr:hypothetical protein [Candidatus Woesebacteria bacterium]